jgi:hypothetical protein
MMEKSIHHGSRRGSARSDDEIARLQREVNVAVDALLTGKGGDFSRVKEAMLRSDAAFQSWKDRIGDEARSCAAAQNVFKKHEFR